MSTILKALKKLEEDKAAALPPDALPLSDIPHQSDGGFNRRRWRILGLLGVLVVCLVLVVSMNFYRQSRDRGKKAVSRAEENGASSSVSPDESRPDKGATGELPLQKSRIVNMYKSVDKLPSLKQETDMRGQPPTMKPPLPAAQNEPQKAVEPLRIEAKKRPARTSLPAVSPRPESAAAGGSVEVSRLTDGRLKVHSIAWSAVPEKRLAVINSSIVHEGDSVDGFVVMTITEDSVVLREKTGAKWRLVIGR